MKIRNTIDPSKESDPVIRKFWEEVRENFFELDRGLAKSIAYGNSPPSTGGGGVTDHGNLTGLADDDHLQYGLLVGRGFQQIFAGGADAGGRLILTGSLNAGSNSPYIMLDAGTTATDTAWLTVSTTNPFGEDPIALDMTPFANALNIQDTRLYIWMSGAIQSGSDASGYLYTRQLKLWDGSLAYLTFLPAVGLSSYSLTWPATSTNGLLRNTGGILSYDATAYGTGTVTSVGLSAPSQFSVSGSPVVGAGTLTFAWQNQTAKYFLAGPTSGGAAAPTFRTLVEDDIVDGSILARLAANETIGGAWTHTSKLTVDMTGGTDVLLDLIEADSFSGGNFIQAYDNDAATYLFYVGPGGNVGCTSLRLIQSATIYGDILIPTLSLARNWTFPDITGTVILSNGTQTLGGTKTFSGTIDITGTFACKMDATHGYFKDWTTTTKQFNFDASGNTASTTRTIYVQDQNGDMPLVGHEAVTAGGAATAGILGKIALTGQTASLAATTLAAAGSGSNLLPAGMYRVSWYVVITTAGDASPTDSLKVTVAWNDGVAAQTKDQIPFNDAGGVAAFSVQTLNKTYCGTQVLYSATTQAITIATTLVNGGATNPAYAIYATVEAI